MFVEVIKYKIVLILVLTCFEILIKALRQYDNQMFSISSTKSQINSSKISSIS